MRRLHRCTATRATLGSTRLVVGLLLLKHIYGLSDESVCDRWVHDPYFQHFTGKAFFQHEFPHERSDLSHWRKRLLELLLAESLRVAHDARALRGRDLKRVTVDTAVQPKAVTFPTDGKLLHAAIEGLNRLVRKHGVRLRQLYRRIAQEGGDDGGTLCSRQAVQAPPPPITPAAQPVWPDHPRHPPQDRWTPNLRRCSQRGDGNANWLRDRARLCRQGLSWPQHR